LVTTGFGLTVTVIVKGAPGQLPVVDEGVTIYCTEPAVALPGFVNVWLIVEPLPAVAPVMPPLMVPIVHEKLLGADAVSAMFGLVPVQMEAVAELVTAGVGLTVTVIVYGCPAQPPVVAVGVTRYWTVPAVVLDGLTRVWLMVLPPPAVAPVIPPLMVPIVHVKLLGTEAVSAILVAVLLQIEYPAALVTTGAGLTVIVIVYGDPAQLPVTEVGVTIYWTVPAVVLLGLVNAWLIVPPDPAVAPVIPPEIVPIVQVKVLGVLAVKVMFGLAPLQIVAVAGLVTAGFGLTVTVIV
jgi:hypothetical protein